MAVRGAVLGAGSRAPPTGARRQAVRALIPDPRSLTLSGQRTATGATGVPVPPTNGSGIADSRNA